MVSNECVVVAHECNVYSVDITDARAVETVWKLELSSGNCILCVVRSLNPETRRTTQQTGREGSFGKNNETRARHHRALGIEKRKNSHKKRNVVGRSHRRVLIRSECQQLSYLALHDVFGEIFGGTISSTRAQPGIAQTVQSDRQVPLYLALHITSTFPFPPAFLFIFR